MKTNAALLALLCLLPLAPLSSGAGGGTVSNVAPQVQAFTGNQATVNNNNAVQETFSMTVFDSNGEGDIVAVQIASTSSTFGTVSWSSIACATPPAGWTCTDSTANDGRLVITYAFTWPVAHATGTYTQTPSVKDATPYVAGPTETTTVTASAVMSFTASQVYDAAGAPVAQNWGAWTANPGAANVNSANYLKAVNTGTAAGTVSVNYQETSFARTGGGTIAIDGNIKFCTAQTSDTSPQAPQALTFSCDSTASADGSRSISVPSHATMWVTYQLASLPAILPSGTYSASYSGA